VARPDAAHRHAVLFVEDHDETREVFVALADAYGFEVVGAPGGREALDYLRQGARPCLILLDLHMPGMDGFAFRRQQMHDATIADIPVAVLTGGGAHDEAAAAPLGFVGFLRKPVEVSALLRLLDSYCTR
jgi:CheY-like chemotaxis protein